MINNKGEVVLTANALLPSSIFPGCLHLTAMRPKLRLEL